MLLIERERRETQHESRRRSSQSRKLHQEEFGVCAVGSGDELGQMERAEVVVVVVRAEGREDYATEDCRETILSHTQGDT